MTKKAIRCEATERGNRCRRNARMRAVLSGGNVIVYSCAKRHVQFAHLKENWDVSLPKDWHKEPRTTSGRQ